MAINVAAIIAVIETLIGIVGGILLWRSGILKDLGEYLTNSRQTIDLANDMQQAVLEARAVAYQARKEAQQIKEDIAEIKDTVADIHSGIDGINQLTVNLAVIVKQNSDALNIIEQMKQESARLLTETKRVINSPPVVIEGQVGGARPAPNKSRKQNNRRGISADN